MSIFIIDEIIDIVVNYIDYISKIKLMTLNKQWRAIITYKINKITNQDIHDIMEHMNMMYITCSITNFRITNRIKFITYDFNTPYYDSRSYPDNILSYKNDVYFIYDYKNHCYDHFIQTMDDIGTKMVNDGLVEVSCEQRYTFKFIDYFLYFHIDGLKTFIGDNLIQCCYDECIVCHNFKDFQSFFTCYKNLYKNII